MLKPALPTEMAAVLMPALLSHPSLLSIAAHCGSLQGWRLA